MTTMLRRGDPLPERVWQALDEAVKRAATHVLAARRVADFEGPRGWDHLVVPTGRTTAVTGTGDMARLTVPEVVPLVEIRAECALAWSVIEAFQRGGVLDASTVEAAAREVALAEDRLAFHGRGGDEGFLAAPESPAVLLGDWAKPGRAVADILSAVERLDTQGVGGPYALVLEPALYYAYLRATVEGGHPATAQIEGVVSAVHRSSVVRSGGLFSTRGGDFVLTVGGDLGVGYCWHDQAAVHLVCGETVAARRLAPEAVCILRAPS
jgi:uncharacterized linocin/CFP29 family protein